MRLAYALLVVGLLCGGCSDDDADDPMLAPDASTTDDADVVAAMCDAVDDGGAAPLVEDCEALSTDYTPGADDDWDACISDDGEYHPIETSISSIARVESFEAIAELLWENSATLRSSDFTAARLAYQEDEGLDSRVVRRYDPHVEVPAGTDCTGPDALEMHPDYCVGPARLQPVLLAAFNAGASSSSTEIERREHAARIEAGLLWFLYVSTFKETLTCKDVPKDCDSGYAYYTGGETARGGIALARYIKRVAPQAHDAAWDGLLAVRCWRDLDDAVPAEDEALRERARLQLDFALQRGMAAVLRERLVVLAEEGCGEQQRADVAFVLTLAPWMDGIVRAQSASSAQTLARALDPERGDLDPAAAIAALDAALGCPR